ncbi:hypothetical protein [Candidatus Magnetaquicoccus inordinatus]|uniref:hypothetical protein n=1 Tax=Candidatus Magnetaquicoccus inordinatus TaxID=2496818 RepID=UPI00102CACD2|nr:hypothetical protein [Candidatus Magnetaquicoccus inordinatus]
MEYSKPNQDSELPRRRKGKQFPACVACHADPGFSWACPCGFALCTECLQKNDDLWQGGGRAWRCPQCGKEHLGPNR